MWKFVINRTAIQAANFAWSIYLLIMVDTLLLRPSLHFTTLHQTTHHFTSLHLSTLHFLPFKLHPTALHYTSLPFGLKLFKFHTVPLHLISLHFTLLQRCRDKCDFEKPILYIDGTWLIISFCGFTSVQMLINATKIVSDMRIELESLSPFVDFSTGWGSASRHRRLCPLVYKVRPKSFRRFVLKEYCAFRLAADTVTT